MSKDVPASGRFADYRSEGFSLIELLVVVAIMSLLLAILLPSLRAARWQSKHLVCQRNLSGIAVAWHEYLTVWKGAFPKSAKAKANTEINFGGRQGSSSAYRGKKLLNPYVGLEPITTKGGELFLCPLDEGAGWIRPTCFEYFGSSYLMNHMLVGQPKLLISTTDKCKDVLAAVSVRIGSLNISQVTDESRLLLVGDYGWYNAWSPLFKPDLHVEWHRRKMMHNAAFVDGHVECIEFRKGLYTTTKYTLIPFREQQGQICSCQEEILCP